jgi:hypothetical protein
MAPRGTFPDGDPSEVVDVLERKVLRGGIARFLRRIDGVAISSAGAEPGSPQASISKSGLTSKGPRVHFSPPGEMTEDDVQTRVRAAALRGPEPRKSFGQYVYDFPGDASGQELVTFALDGLRALGAEPANGMWEYQGTEPEAV